MELLGEDLWSVGALNKRRIERFRMMEQRETNSLPRSNQELPCPWYEFLYLGLNKWFESFIPVVLSFRIIDGLPLSTRLFARDCRQNKYTAKFLYKTRLELNI